MYPAVDDDDDTDNNNGGGGGGSSGGNNGSSNVRERRLRYCAMVFFSASPPCQLWPGPCEEVSVCGVYACVHA